MMLYFSGAVINQTPFTLQGFSSTSVGIALLEWDARVGSEFPSGQIWISTYDKNLRQESS